MTKYNYNRVTHYIPPTNFAALEHEFVEPNSSDNFIFWLFRYRCAECKKPGSEINEIVPRSRSKKSVMDWRNRIVLCRECHQKYHLNGVSDDKINSMQNTRKEYLNLIGRDAYV